MDHLDAFVKLYLFLLIAYHSLAHDLEKRSIFSWGKEATTRVPDAVVPGYLPTLKVHKYNGIQINPVHGSPIYLPNALSESSNAITLEQFPTAQLSAENVQQLDILNRVVSFLPDEDRLHEFDVTPFLPYVDLISEDSLGKLQYAVESSKDKENSKLAKLIGFLKSVKEKKLKPFKYAAHLGNTLINKKKEKVQTAFSYLNHPFAEATTQAPQIVSEIPTLPGGYPFNFQVNHQKNSFPGIPSAGQPQQPFPANPFPGLPSADQLQQSLQSSSAAASSPRVDSLVQNSQFYEFPPHYLTQAGTFLPNSNDVQSYQSAPSQNDRVLASTPSPRVQFSESQYQQLPYSFPQHNYAAFPQPQSFVQQKNQFQTLLDTQFPSQQVNPQVAFNAAPSAQSTQHLSPSYQFPQQNTNYHDENYHDETSTQSNAKPESTKYYQPPSNTYANSDLTGSASENIEKIGERSNSNKVAASAETENDKNTVQETVTANVVETHHNIVVPSPPPKSKITRLYPVTGEPSVHIVYPQPSWKNKETDNNDSSAHSAQKTSKS